MANDEYQEQRIEGAKQIIEKAKDLAKDFGLTAINCEWDHGQKISSKVAHSLSIKSGGKQVTGKFPDEWLADYPGKAGNEKGNALLTGMVRQLSAGSRT